ncbi:MAG: VWA domain-containing protein, partial [Candidatus Riflebacteria bacterium]|nr:VWA domain-containing protein [Candidatus Riflebacteria bacterium]
MRNFILSIMLIVLLFAGTVAADAAYLVFSQGNLPMMHQKVNVKITNQVAVTRLEMVFYNPHDFTIQPNIKFPVHEKASVQNFSLTDSEGMTYEGRIEEAAQAQETFNEAKAEGMMPAMAVQKQPGVFETSIGAIGPKSRATVMIEYSEILPYNKGSINYSMPFNVGGFQTQPLEAVTMVVEVTDQKEITGLTSPTHDIYAEKVDGNNWKMVFEKNNFLSNSDFKLVYEVKADTLAANFLATRPDAAKDGYFVLMLSPQEIVEQKNIVNRDIVFVMDTSGSMSGNKLAQTKKAFNFFINKLNEKDRFGIVSFSSTAVLWQLELKEVNDQNRQQANAFIEQLRAAGGTNIDDSLRHALTLFDGAENRTSTLIFLTDGEASNGETSTSKIVNNFNHLNFRKVRTFTLGVGNSVNTKLLNQLALENRGEAVYLDEQKENIDEELISFYQTISTPLLVDLALDMQGIEVTDIYPKTLPNMYQGTQLVVTGRYRTAGEAQIKLSGMINAEKYEFPIQAVFPASSTENLFAARYWARTKADDLMLQMQTYGQKQAMKDEVIALSKEFQFSTPFTSFIAVSTTPVPQVGNMADAGSAKRASTLARVNRGTPVKRTIVRKTEAKGLSLWGASGFLPIAAIAVPNFRKAREQAREKACYANMRVLLGAVEMYNMDNTSQLDVLTENEIPLLVEGKYLKSMVVRPEAGCSYGTVGDLRGKGTLVCALHGTVEDEQSMQEMLSAEAGPGNQSIYYDAATNQYVEAVDVVVEEGLTPWTTRIWNNYLSGIVSILINVPLFILGLAFTAWVVYIIIM